jgi:hypothetical protein
MNGAMQRNERVKRRKLKFEGSNTIFYFYFIYIYHKIYLYKVSYLQAYL